MKIIIMAKGIAVGADITRIYPEEIKRKDKNASKTTNSPKMLDGKYLNSANKQYTAIKIERYVPK